MSLIQKYNRPSLALRIAIFVLCTLLLAMPFPPYSRLPLWGLVLGETLLFLFVFVLVPGLFELHAPYQIVLLLLPLTLFDAYRAAFDPAV